MAVCARRSADLRGDDDRHAGHHGVGIPLTHIGFAGFLSKDAVIESAFVGSTYAFWMLVIAALMTSFYSWRLMFMTFFGSPRGDHHAHDHAA